MQVTVEIRVEPKPRAHRAAVFVFVLGSCNSPVSEDPACAAVFNRCFEECVPGEPAPRFQLRSNALFVTEQRDQITRPASAQHSEQLRQEARCESLSPNVQLDVSPHRNACILQFPWSDGRPSTKASGDSFRMARFIVLSSRCLIPSA